MVTVRYHDKDRIIVGGRGGILGSLFAGLVPQASSILWPLINPILVNLGKVSFPCSQLSSIFPSDEGLTLETSALVEILYGGQCTLSKSA